MRKNLRKRRQIQLSEFKIAQKQSPNKMSRQGWKPDMIVSHITEGNFDGAVSWLCNLRSQASSHFVVARDGRITQLVDLKEAAWINGTSTDSSKSNHYSRSTLKLVRDRKTNANYYTIGIEHEGFSNQGNGKLTDIQLEATVWLHKHIIKEVKRIYSVDISLDREHIVGHYQIDPIRKPNCPGANFQWVELIEALKPKEVIKVGSVFRDVADNRWSAKDIEKAAKLGIIVGDDKGNFNPTGNLTREQAAVIAVRIIDAVKGGK